MTLLKLSSSQTCGTILLEKEDSSTKETAYDFESAYDFSCVFISGQRGTGRGFA